MAATIQPAPQNQALRGPSWWRWAVVLIPGALLFFFPLPGLDQQQSRLFGIFLATINSLELLHLYLG